jgi:curved DNA-binding protein CbpA
MRDHYETLEVPENASAAWIEREYNKRVERTRHDSKLDERHRAKRLSELETAYATLSDDKKRAAYDAEIEKKRERREAMRPRALLKRLMLPVIALLIIGGVAGNYFYQQHQAEAFRIAEEQERQAAQKRAEEAAVARAQREQADRVEAEARRQADEARLRLEQEQRTRDLATQKFVTDPAFVRQQAAERAEQARVQAILDERRRNIEGVRSDPDAVRQRQELERQRRFLEQMKQEEELAQKKRAEAALRAQQRESAPQPQ